MLQGSSVYVGEGVRLLKDDREEFEIYRFFDEWIQAKCGSTKVKVRQVVTPDEFAALSDARLRLYGQRKSYYKSFFGESTGLDSYDSRSYIFAFYYDGEIVGTQRITPYPHEAANYIEGALLQQFVGRNYRESCVEFSRLVVDKKAPVKGIAEALASTGGVLVAFNTSYTQYVTYVKPRMANGFSQDSFFGRESIYFQIKERGSHYYALYKGDLRAAVVNYFELTCSVDELTCMRKLMRAVDMARRESAVELA